MYQYDSFTDRTNRQTILFNDDEAIVGLWPTEQAGYIYCNPWSPYFESETQSLGSITPFECSVPAVSSNGLYPRWFAYCEDMIRLPGPERCLASSISCEQHEVMVTAGERPIRNHVVTCSHAQFRWDSSNTPFQHVINLLVTHSYGSCAGNRMDASQFCIYDHYEFFLEISQFCIVESSEDDW